MNRTLAKPKRVVDRPTRQKDGGGIIVSKNSHRVWCIIKVQSVVRRWLAIRLVKRMRIEREQMMQRAESIIDSAALAAEASVQKILHRGELQQQQQIPQDNHPQEPIEDKQEEKEQIDVTIAPALPQAISSSQSQEDEPTPPCPSKEQEQEEEEDEEESQQQEQEQPTSSTSTSSTSQEHKPATRAASSLSIDSIEEETPFTSRSSSMSSCVSSSSISSSPSTHTLSLTLSSYRTSPERSTSPTSSPSPIQSPLPTPVSKRRKTIDELVKVERGYVTDMTTLVELFMQPLKQSELLSDDNLALLFSNIQELRQVHIRLLEALEKYIESFSESSTLGDIFHPFMGDFQKHYEIYINNYEKAFTYAQHIRANGGAVYKILLAGECHDVCRNLDFGSFLVMPVQRLPRYIMLLKEIEKQTPPDHPDINLIGLTLCQLHDLTLYLNESKRTASDTDKVNDIKSMVTGADAIIGNSKFIMEGQLALLKGVVASAKKELFVFLFRDCILCTEATPNEGSHSPKRQVKSKTLSPSSSHPPLISQLSSMSLSGSLGGSNKNNSLTRKTLFKSILFTDVKTISVLKNIKDSFQIVTTKKVYTFVAPTTEMRDKWMSALTECLPNTSSSSTTSQQTTVSSVASPKVARKPEVASSSLSPSQTSQLPWRSKTSVRDTTVQLTM